MTSATIMPKSASRFSPVKSDLHPLKKRLAQFWRVIMLRARKSLLSVQVALQAAFSGVFCKSDLQLNRAFSTTSATVQVAFPLLYINLYYPTCAHTRAYTCGDEFQKSGNATCMVDRLSNGVAAVDGSAAA